MEDLDKGFAIQAHMQAGVIIVPEPARESFLEVLAGAIGL